MRWQLIIGTLIALLFLAAPTPALELQQLDGEWWLGAPRDNAAAVVKFENQLFGTVQISGDGVSVPQRNGFTIDPGQILQLEPSGRLTGTIAVTSDDMVAGTWTINGGSFEFLKNRLVLRGRLQIGQGAGSRMTLAGTRIEDRTDEAKRQLLRGRSSEVSVRGARKTMSRRIDVILDVVRDDEFVEDPTRPYPFYQLLSGGNIRRGAERVKLGIAGTVLLTPNGGLVGYVGADTFPVAGNEDPEQFLGTLIGLAPNATLTGRLPGYKTVVGDFRPMINLRVKTSSNALRARLRGQLGPFLRDAAGDVGGTPDE